MRLLTALFTLLLPCSLMASSPRGPPALDPSMIRTTITEARDSSNPSALAFDGIVTDCTGCGFFGKAWSNYPGGSFNTDWWMTVPPATSRTVSMAITLKIENDSIAKLVEFNLLEVGEGECYKAWPWSDCSEYDPCSGAVSLKLQSLFAGTCEYKITWENYEYNLGSGWNEIANSAGSPTEFELAENYQRSLGAMSDGDAWGIEGWGCGCSSRREFTIEAKPDGSEDWAPLTIGYLELQCSDCAPVVPGWGD